MIKIGNKNRYKYTIEICLQLTMKEKEILRLKKMLEGGRPYLAVSKDCACKKAESSFVMSNYNIDGNELKVLQQEKLELEQQLKGNQTMLSV